MASWYPDEPRKRPRSWRELAAELALLLAFLVVLVFGAELALAVAVLVSIAFGLGVCRP